MKKHKPGYYIDQAWDIAIVYPCGKIEVLNFWQEYSMGGLEGYHFSPIEFISSL